MTAPGLGYDEIGSRTRQAWLRTSLGVVAVTLLVLRGLAVAGAPGWTLALGVVPAAVFLTLAVRRTGRLQHGESSPASRRFLALALVSLAALALMGTVGVVAGSMGG